MTRTPMRPEARELAFDRSRSIPNALTQAESLAGESPSELFERMTVDLFALHAERLDLVEAYESRIAELERIVGNLVHMVGP